MEKVKTVETNNSLTRLFIFALISHILMFVLFFIYDVTTMMYFNIVSILLYVVLIIISKSSVKTKLIPLSVVSSVLEVICHQVLAIICVGSDIGFEYYVIMIGLVAMLQAKEIVTKKAKILYCTIILCLIVLVKLHAAHNEPIYILPDTVKYVLLSVVTFISIFGIFAFSFIQWNLNEHYKTQIEELLSDRNIKIQEMQEKIIRNFADIIEKRDGSTGGHIKRTSAYVQAIIDALYEDGKYKDSLTAEYSKMIVSAAPLHDIGKISISDSILCKKGKLTTEEFDIMKTHSLVGGSMLKDLLGNLESDEYVHVATDISRYHHEKWNGKGYPEGISKFEIPLSARIMAVADVFDALTSVRCYKEKYTLDEAYKIIEEESGKQFDPVIINEFIRIKPRMKKIYARLKD